MPLFRYKAKNSAGLLMEDVIEAEDYKSVVAHLQAKSYFPLDITLEKKAFAWPSFKRHPGLNDLVLFSRQLAELLKGGLSLSRALELAAKQTENHEFKNIILDVRERLQTGSSFSAALADHPSVFTALYTGIVKAGEAGGSLDQSMERIAAYLKQGMDLRAKVKTAMAYPLAMLGVGILTVLFLLIFVIPKFMLMFSDVDQVLPLPTRVLITMSTLITHWWLFLLVGVIMLVVLAKRYLLSAAGRRNMDRIKIGFPVLGAVVKEEMAVRFTRTLGILLANGIPMAQALEMVKRAVGNEVVSADIERIHSEIKTGRGLVESLASSKTFPPVLSDLVAAGEEVGSLEKSLLEIASTYETRVENNLRAATSLLEPIIILLMGLLVGFIVVAMLLPIFELSGTIK
jgi:type II secretory pathway component PulF